MKVRIFTIAFGEHYLGWFERGLVQSLMWPKNREAIRSRVEAYDVWTTAESAGRAHAIAERVGVPIDLHILGGGDRAALFPALIAQMELCYGKAFIFAGPDILFGDGTIGHMIEAGRVPGICVSFMPLRVNEPGFIEGLDGNPYSNARLVRYGMARAHRGFTDGEANLARTNSYHSGMSWRRLSEDLYAITGRLPSAFFMQPTRRDVKWMLDRPKFGNYDHQFAKTLVDAQRQRVIGSSDAAFAVEVTPLVTGVAELTDTDPREPDRFIQDLSHYAVNRNVLAIWRAGE